MLVLMPKCKKNIEVFRTCIDDAFAIWKKQGEYDNEFEEFKKTLSAISNLNWECEELSDKVNFLDLGISTNRESKIFGYKIHVRKEALASCMPPHSVHLPN